jgi:hypothetical protein
LARRLAWIVVLLIAVGFGAHLAWGYDADELQNLHFAWSIAHGLFPYRDFFEHHPPLLHYALAPFVGGMDSPGWGLLVGTRIVALTVALALALFLFKLIRRQAGAFAAATGVAMLVVTHPFGTTAFELRADWIALAALIASVGRLTNAMSSSGGRDGFRHAVIGGALAGFGIVLTQKTAFLIGPLLLWAAGCAALAPNREIRRQRLTKCALFALCVCVPPLLLVLWFAGHGALRELIASTFLINLRWASEGDWRYTLNESLPPILPIAVLAMYRLGETGRNIRIELEQASDVSAVALLLLAGLAVLLTTPVPHGQSYLFLCVPWGAYLAAVCLKDIEYDLGRLSRRPISLGFALIVCLAAMNPKVACLSATVWGTAVLLAQRGRGQIRQVRRAAVMTTLILALGAVVCLGRAGDRLWKREGVAQARFIAEVNRRIPPQESALETWPLVTPFRPQPTFHGFARRGPAQTIGVKLLEDEYIHAAASGRVRWVVVDDRDVRRQLPRFGAYLDDSCSSQAPPATRDRLRLYDCSRW